MATEAIVYTGNMRVSSPLQYKASVVIFVWRKKKEKEMSRLDFSECRKRRRTERVYKFKFFGSNGYPVDFSGPSFERNVKALLEFGREDRRGTTPRWSFQLEVRRMHLFLFVVAVEKKPAESLPIELRCKHCQHTGWGHHLICNKKYHFVLPLKSDEYHETVENGDDENRHSLHGMFHSNGFGHLLCINGLEAGSALAGYELMEFWDRLCSGLGARKVSLKDTSRKKGMELRLLHGVAYGKPWFGKWDYAFGRGSYGVDEESYTGAVTAIQTIPLRYIPCTRNFETIQLMLPRIQLLSGHSLSTLGDLFRFVLELRAGIPKEARFDPPHQGIMSDASCRWSAKRVSMAIRVVVEALKRAEVRWVSRQHVRDQARAYIGDTGLLDFVLKSLGNHLVGKYFIRRCLNPVTKVLEYCLEDVSDAVVPQKLLRHHQLNPSSAQIDKDIHQIYAALFGNIIGDGALSKIPPASRIILDSKHLIKDYGGEEAPADNKWKVYCNVILTNDGEEEEEEVAATPQHCFLLRNCSDFDELKSDVERVFRETYWELKNFSADTIRNANPKGSDLVFKTVKPGSGVVFEGKRSWEGGGGMEDAVECVCGTKDDDGERMVPCDVCQVRQHARCVGIPESDEIPSIFMCAGCEEKILSFPSLP
ncbi:hypothetical protein M569_08321 [Genlisea aurea]|uniref:Zinc finger PHD-type domain-containing protein n=1 Tax=Genlisea aurea TaxID=192259 RepID=S8E2H0_9LAMI|nr:hypothetical protein M569_08321 [Genlisea aurea]